MEQACNTGALPAYVLGMPCSDYSQTTYAKFVNTVVFAADSGQQQLQQQQVTCKPFDDGAD
jgi:hypothetical protein